MELPAGGLVSSLLTALESIPSSLWIGWDGRAEPGGRLTESRARGVTLAGLGLTRSEVSGYYDGFCNQALWPLLHCLPGRLAFDAGHLETYLAVQERFADVVAPDLDVTRDGLVRRTGAVVGQVALLPDAEGKPAAVLVDETGRPYDVMLEGGEIVLR